MLFCWVFLKGIMLLLPLLIMFKSNLTILKSYITVLCSKLDESCFQVHHFILLKIEQSFIQIINWASFYNLVEPVLHFCYTYTCYWKSLPSNKPSRIWATGVSIYTLMFAIFSLRFFFKFSQPCLRALHSRLGPNPAALYSCVSTFHVWAFSSKEKETYETLLVYSTWMGTTLQSYPQDLF